MTPMIGVPSLTILGTLLSTEQATAPYRATISVKRTKIEGSLALLHQAHTLAATSTANLAFPV